VRIVFVVVLSVLVVASCLAWRLKPKDIEHGRTRLIWVSYDNPAKREQIEAFNRRHDDLLLTLDPSNIQIEKIIVQSVAGIGPDLFDVADRFSLAGFVEAGIALDLTDIAAKHGFDLSKTWPRAADAARIGGRQYGFPCNIVGKVLFYNKALFDKYHVPYPAREWNWDEFVKVASQLTRKSPDGRSYECFAAAEIQWYELLLQAGGRIYNRDRTECVLDSPEAVEATRFYYDLIYKHHIMPRPQEQAAMGSEGGWPIGPFKWFATGRIAMIRAGRWVMMTFRNYEDLRGKIGACHLPYNKKKAVLIGARICAINRHSNKTDQAIKFLQYLTSPEYNMQIVRSANSMPPVPQFADREEFLHDPNHPEEDFNDIFAQAIQRGVVPEISPLISPWAANNIIREHIELMISKLKSPQQTCKDITFAINKGIYRNLCKYEKFRLRYEKITGREFDPDDARWRRYR